jgi:hypothetical protein
MFTVYNNYCCIINSFMFHKGHQGIDGQLPRGVKNYPVQFNRFPYYEHLQKSRLFDTMHFRKNVIETLWIIFDGKNDLNKKLSKSVMTFRKTIIQCTI